MYSLHFAQMAWADNLVDELCMTPILQAVIDEMDEWMATVVDG